LAWENYLGTMTGVNEGKETENSGNVCGLSASVVLYGTVVRINMGCLRVPYLT